MKISDFKAQYPEYEDMSDQELADALHGKFYSDIPKQQFYKDVGLEGGLIDKAKGAIGGAVDAVKEFVSGDSQKSVMDNYQAPAPSAPADPELGMLSQAGWDKIKQQEQEEPLDPRLWDVPNNGVVQHAQVKAAREAQQGRETFANTIGNAKVDQVRQDEEKAFQDRKYSASNMASLYADSAQNMGNSILKIGPTAAKGVFDIFRLASSDRLGVQASEYMDRSLKAMDEVLASDYFNAQNRGFKEVMNDPNSDIGDMFNYVIDNPGILSDSAITTIGSMFLPAGAAGAAATGAKALNLGSKAAGSLATGATVATTMAQNAADTFTSDALKGASMDARQDAARVSAAVTLLMGFATRGGAEGLIARRMAGELQAGRVGLDKAKAFLKTIGKEATQEGGEELGGILGEAVGTGEAPNINNAAKRIAFASTLGAVMGGGTQAAFGNGPAESNAWTQATTKPAPTIADIGASTTLDEAIAAAQAVVANAGNPGNVPEDAAALSTDLAEVGQSLRSVSGNVEEDGPAPGFVRLYHGGSVPDGGPRWLTPDVKYAQGYAAKSSSGVYYVDVPEDSQFLKKAFDDTGTSTKAPYVEFEAPAEIARNLKPIEAPKVWAYGDNKIEPTPFVDPRAMQGRGMLYADPAQVTAEIERNRAEKSQAGRMQILDEWTAFPPETGTIGIPRAEMPQIKAEHRGAMVNFLNARGISHEQIEVSGDELKPTQAEFSLAKVEKAKQFEGGDRSILISSDGHVLDGHHQWLAKSDAGLPVKAIRLNAPIKQLLPIVKDFPSAEQADGATEAAQPATSDVGNPISGNSTVRFSRTVPEALIPVSKRSRTGAQRFRDKLKAENPFVAFLAEYGIHPADRADSGVERGRAGNPLIPGYGPIFRRTGIRVDELAEAARSAGFLSQADIDSDNDNGGVNKLQDMIRRALDGREVIQRAGNEPAVSRNDKDLLDEAERLGIDTTQPIEAVYDAVIAAHAKLEAAREEIGTKSIDVQDEIADYADKFDEAEAAYAYELMNDPPIDGGIPTNHLTDEEIDALFGLQTKAENGRQAEENPAEQARNGAEGTRAPASGKPILEQYSREEVIERQDADAERAKRVETERKRLDDQAKAERERKEMQQRQESAADAFTLDAQVADASEQKKIDRQKAEQDFSGQSDIFSAPAQQEEAAPAQDLDAMFDDLLAEETKPEDIDDGADIPRAFFKKVKVDHEVWIDEESRYETIQITADKALDSVREDIANLRALLKCMKG